MPSFHGEAVLPFARRIVSECRLQDETAAVTSIPAPATCLVRVLNYTGAPITARTPAYI